MNTIRHPRRRPRVRSFTWRALGYLLRIEACYYVEKCLCVDRGWTIPSRRDYAAHYDGSAVSMTRRRIRLEPGWGVKP